MVAFGDGRQGMRVMKRPAPLLLLLLALAAPAQAQDKPADTGHVGQRVARNHAGALSREDGQAVRQVMELARAKGCRSIGFLKNRSNFMADSSRIRDAITAAGEYGLRVPPHAVVEAEDTYEGGAVGIKTMMTGGSLLATCTAKAGAFAAFFRET